MIKHLLLSFIFLTSLYSQNVNNATLKITYSHSVNLEYTPNAITLNAFLTSNKEASIYELDFNNETNFINEENYGNENDSKTLIRVRSKKNPVFYKKLRDKTVFYKQRISMKSFLVKDTFGAFSWEVKKDTKVILGYTCQKAVTTFRGRNYEVYFTLELPFNVGPWKFDGLPGTILEIKEKNDVLNITADKVEISNTKTTIKNPFINQKPITWDAYVDEYKKKYKELKSYRGPKGTRVNLPKKNIEVYIEE